MYDYNDIANITTTIAFLITGALWGPHFNNVHINVIVCNVLPRPILKNDMKYQAYEHMKHATTHHDP